MASSLAWRRDAKRCKCKRSTFNEPNSVSLQALSQQSPRLLIDWTISNAVIGMHEQSRLGEEPAGLGAVLRIDVAGALGLAAVFEALPVR